MPREPQPLAAAGPERALLVQVIHGRQSREEAQDSLAELERLADTAGLAPVGVVTQKRDRPTPQFYIGEGKLPEIQLAGRQTGARLVLFDNDLTAVQVNNLDLALQMRVLDRTELILQIFGYRKDTPADPWNALVRGLPRLEEALA